MSTNKLTWRPLIATPAAALAAGMEPGEKGLLFSYGPIRFDCFSVMHCSSIASMEPGSGLLREALQALDRHCARQLGTRLIVTNPINLGVYRACGDVDVKMMAIEPPSHEGVRLCDALMQLGIAARLT